MRDSRGEPPGPQRGDGEYGWTPGAPVWLPHPKTKETPRSPDLSRTSPRAFVGSRRTREGSRESSANTSFSPSRGRTGPRNWPCFPSWFPPPINIKRSAQRQEVRGCYGVPVLSRGQGGQAFRLPRAEYRPGRSTVLAGNSGNGRCGFRRSVADSVRSGPLHVIALLLQ